MSKISCDACVELKENAPEFVMNGVTDDVAASLRNDTGFNPKLTVTHNNCQDLNDANDCLIGRMDNELEAYEVCDWKEYMHKLMPNMYEILKAMIAGDCGQWDQIHSLCGMINDILYNNMSAYGTLTGTRYDSATARKGGEILSKDGTPLVEKADTDNLWNGVGILYLKRQYRNCDGELRTYEFIQPYLRDYIFKNISYGESFWRASKSQLRAWGCSEALIKYFEAGPQWRTGYGNAYGSQKTSTISMHIAGDYFELGMMGSIGDINDVIINTDIYNPVIIIS